MIAIPRDGKKKSRSPAIVPVAKKMLEIGKKLARKTADERDMAGCLRMKAKKLITAPINIVPPKIVLILNKFLATSIWL